MRLCDSTHASRYMRHSPCVSNAYTCRYKIKLNGNACFNSFNFLFSLHYLVGRERIELSTNGLKVHCSTAELTAREVRHHT